MNQIKDFFIRFAAFAKLNKDLMLPYAALILLPLIPAFFRLSYTMEDGAAFFAWLGILLVILLVTYVLQINIQKRYYSFCHPEQVEYATNLQVILQNLKIAFLQFLILLGIMIVPILLVIAFLAAARDDALLVKVVISLAAIGVSLWMYRLVFVPYILILKRNSYRMKDIVDESRQFFLGNRIAFNLYLAMILVVFIPALLFSFYSVNEVVVTIVEVIQSLFSILYIFLNMHVFSVTSAAKPDRPADVA